MTTYCELTTVTDVKTTYIGTSGTSSDALLLSLIRSTSREIEAAANRRFVPRVETRTYNTPAQPADALMLDDDLLALTTLTNGDGDTFTAAQYKLYPLNATPKYKIVVLASSTEKWTTTNGDPEGAISVTGIWGHHDDYGSAWLATGATLAAAITNTTVTTFTCTTGLVRAGDLLQIDTEYLYASSVSTGANDTVTCVRGVNGSTAATHLISAAISRWTHQTVQQLCVMAVVAYERLRVNPIGDTVTLDGFSFSTPRDVKKYIGTSLAALGLIRTGLG